jgi:hypothetical protein
MKGKLKDRVEMSGVFRGQLIDAKTGKVVQEEVTHNLITDVGENMLAYLAKGDTTTKGFGSYFSLCDSTADPAEGDTTEVGGNKGPRKAVTATVAGSKVTFEATWGTSEANYTIRRGYIFSAASGGNLLATGKFTTPFAKTSDYTYKATYELTFA